MLKCLKNILAFRIAEFQRQYSTSCIVLCRKSRTRLAIPHHYVRLLKNDPLRCAGANADDDLIRPVTP